RKAPEGRRAPMRPTRLRTSRDDVHRWLRSGRSRPWSSVSSEPQRVRTSLQLAALRRCAAFRADLRRIQGEDVMPLFYTDVPGATQTTNAAANTANDCFFIKPGATRTVWIKAIYPEGRGATLTAISGISYRLEKWTATASSGGTAITPSPNDTGYQAAKHTAGFAVA